MACVYTAVMALMMICRKERNSSNIHINAESFTNNTDDYPQERRKPRNSKNLMIRDSSDELRSVFKQVC